MTVTNLPLGRGAAILALCGRLRTVIGAHGQKMLMVAAVPRRHGRRSIAIKGLSDNAPAPTAAMGMDPGALTGQAHGRAA